MTKTRDLSNKRIQIWLGPASGLSSYDSATEAELAALVTRPRIAAPPGAYWASRERRAFSRAFGSGDGKANAT